MRWEIDSIISLILEIFKGLVRYCWTILTVGLSWWHRLYIRLPEKHFVFGQQHNATLRNSIVTSVDENSCCYIIVKGLIAQCQACVREIQHGTPSVETSVDLFTYKYKLVSSSRSYEKKLAIINSRFFSFESYGASQMKDVLNYDWVLTRPAPYSFDSTFASL